MLGTERLGLGLGTRRDVGVLEVEVFLKDGQVGKVGARELDRVEVAGAGYTPVTLDKGDNKKFKAACQNAVFEYQVFLNPVK